MKPQHQLILRKLGMGKGLPARNLKKGEMRTMDVRDSEMPMPDKKIQRDMKMLETKMEGMGVTKAKRRPLKFKL
jgi:hypothetical protein